MFENICINNFSIDRTYYTKLFKFSFFIGVNYTKIYLFLPKEEMGVHKVSFHLGVCSYSRAAVCLPRECSGAKTV